MRKKRVAIMLATAMILSSTLGVTGCGAKELALMTDKMSVELGTEMSTNAADYVSDEKQVAEATVDVSAVDTSKVGNYTATITYKDQTTTVEVDVIDTTAPVADVTTDPIVLGVGDTLTADVVMTGVIELSGNVMAKFADVSENVEDTESTETVEDTEAVETTESTETTETVEVTEAVVDTEAVENTEIAEDADLGTFVLGDVTVKNDVISFDATGDYNITLTITDDSGNNTTYTLAVMVGTAPVLSGVEDLTATVGDAEIDYMNGVTAVDCNGNDITDAITCDYSKVDLNTAGEYEITYSVADENGFTIEQTAKVVVAEKTGKANKDSKSDKSGKNNTGKTSDSKSGKTTGSTESATGNSGNTSSGSSSSNSSSANTNSGSSNSGSSSSNSSGNNSSSGSNNSGNSGTSSSGSNNGGNSSSANTTPSNNSGSENSASSNDNGNNGSNESNGGGNSASSADTGSSSGSSSSGGDMSVPDNAIPGDPSLGNNDINSGIEGSGGVDSTITFH